MARHEVRFVIELPDEIQATELQVREWVRFHLNENGELRDNPLEDLELEAVTFSVEVTKLPKYRNQPALDPKLAAGRRQNPAKKTEENPNA